MTTSSQPIPPTIDGIPLGPTLTRRQARAIAAKGSDVVIFALMHYAAQLAAATSAHPLRPVSPVHPGTPSGMIPPYQKPPVRQRRKTPGRKAGHAGSRRPIPSRIDRRQVHRLKRCPHCHGPVQSGRRMRVRYVEDMPEGLRSEVTAHQVHPAWCPHCREMVEPVVPDALPRAMIGHRTTAMTAWLHYGLGNTISQVISVFNHHFEMKMTEGGLVQMWKRLARLLRPWYEEIHDRAMQSILLHADETGWRVQAETWWLWCFGNEDLTFYWIDRSRGSPALQRVFTEPFHGTLVSDFWGAYNAVNCTSRQMCLAHLVREFKTVEQYKDTGSDWPLFVRRLRRLIHDAMRLSHRRESLRAESYASRRDRIHRRLGELINSQWENPEARRLLKRLRRHQGDLFTFLDRPEVPYDNNHAERSIRPAVILRKNSYANRSLEGAECQSILMSILRTLHQRGHSPSRVIADALREYMISGILPPLPEKCAGNG